MVTLLEKAGLSILAIFCQKTSKKWNNHEIKDTVKLKCSICGYIVWEGWTKHSSHFVSKTLKTWIKNNEIKETIKLKCSICGYNVWEGWIEHSSQLFCQKLEHSSHLFVKYFEQSFKTAKLNEKLRMWKKTIKINQNACCWIKNHGLQTFPIRKHCFHARKLSN